MIISCPYCRERYEVSEYEANRVKCMKCGCTYYQEQCDVEVTIMDYIKTDDK